MGRALRADAERSVRAILAAAERVLAQDAGASMEQIAEAAGLTRITVHRRFANRQALLEALAVSAKQQLIDAIEEARPDSAPALVALYRVTANVMRVKNTWRYTSATPRPAPQPQPQPHSGRRSTPAPSNSWTGRSARGS
ncbi:TetR/AcrR family transcriptional regulator [Streptomyces canus]|uniref:TetR/AcrR family transcriptional regulator n=1 Tax=Streptomyces canus TaxID=58343 RepID=UPI0036A5C884